MPYKPRRKPCLAPVESPPVPCELMVYDATAWLLPDDPPAPDDGFDVPAWEAWEAAHVAAYARWEAARQAWYAEHGYPSIETAIATPDEPFDPTTDL